MSLILPSPNQTSNDLIVFIQSVFLQTKKKLGVIAVSGGIDSALALTLLVKALGREHVHAVLLPYRNQDMADANTICDWNQIPSSNRHEFAIEPIVRAAEELVFDMNDQGTKSDQIRRGNLMARSRMMVTFDFAKARDGLVCGTENKSEHYLGYFTRFGDAASDLEPISTLYKTQVRQLAEHLQLPEIFLEKAPSAGLWDQQSDELELGFSYHDADLVLEQLIDQKKDPSQIQVEALSPTVIRDVINQVESMRFKRMVPYTL